MADRRVVNWVSVVSVVSGVRRAAVGAMVGGEECACGSSCWGVAGVA
jgi:hypothetical protein